MARKAAIEDQGLPSLSLVFGYVAVKELQRREDQVRVLSRLGYGIGAIATICDTTPASVRSLRHLAVKKTRAKKAKGNSK